MQPDLLTLIVIEYAKGVADSLDTVYCPRCHIAPRRLSLGEAQQEERDGGCVWVCGECGSVCDESPF